MSEKKVVVIDKFAVLESGKQRFAFENGTLYSYAAKNCSAMSDVLQRSVGVQPFYWEGEQVPFGDYFASARSFWILQNLNQDGSLRKVLGFITKAGVLYAYDTQAKAWVKKHDFECATIGAVAIEEGEKQVLALGNEQGLFIFDDELGLRKVSGVEKVKTMAYFNGRIFVASEHLQLYYSAPFTLDNFSESIDDGGRISLPTDRGGCIEIRVVNGELFLFFERGIFAITSGGSARDFAVKEVAFCEGKVIVGSFANVCSPQEKAFFLTENGVCVFDGKKVERVCENITIEPKQGGQVFVHGQFDGNYYISFQSTAGKKQVYVDGKSGLGAEVFSKSMMAELGGELLCADDGFLKRVKMEGQAPIGEIVQFNLENVNFGVFGRMAWKSIRLFGSGKAYLTMNYKGKLCSWHFDLENGKNEAILHLIGEKFAFWFQLSEGARITRMEVELSVPSKGKAIGGYV